MKNKCTKFIMSLFLMITLCIIMLTPVTTQAASKKSVSISTAISNDSSMYVNTYKSMGVKTNVSSTITYQTSDSKMAKVKSGRLYAYKPGTVKVTVTARPKSSRYKTTSKSIYVRISPGKPGTPVIKRDKSTVTVNIKKTSGAYGYQYQYAANSKMSGAKTIRSRDTSYSFKAYAPRTYYVRVRSYVKVSGKYYYSGWTSVKKVSSFHIKAQSITSDDDTGLMFRGVGGHYQLTADVKPLDATNRKVNWSTSDSQIATVNEKGYVTAVGVGNCVITAVSDDNPKLSIKFEIIVDDPENPLFAKQVMELVNKERAKEGLPALTTDERITKAAMVRAAELEELFSHTRPDGTACFTALNEAGVSYWTAGENIAMGQWSPESVMNSWMNSPGHRANILDRSFRKIGVGYYRDKYGRNCWTQFFVG